WPVMARQRERVADADGCVAAPAVGDVRFALSEFVDPEHDARAHRHPSSIDRTKRATSSWLNRRVRRKASFRSAMWYMAGGKVTPMPSKTDRAVCKSVARAAAAISAGAASTTNSCSNA